MLDGQRKIRIQVDIESQHDRPPVLLFGISHSNGLPLYGVSNEMDRTAARRLAAGRYRFEVELDLGSLLPGQYQLRLHSMDSEGLRLFDTREVELVLRGATREFGVVRLPHVWHEA